MTIRQRILAGYLLVFVVCVVIGLFALQNMHRMKDSYANVVDHHVYLVNETQKLLLAFEYEALMLRTYFLTGLPEWKDEYLKQAQRRNDILHELETKISTEEERAVFVPLARSLRSFETDYAVSQLAIRENELLTEQEKMAQIRQLTVAQRGTVRGVITQGEDFIAYQQAILDRTVAASARWVESLTAVTAVMLAGALVLGVGAAFYISRTISEPLRILEEETRLLTTGDLSIREIGVVSRDEVGRLARSLARMSEQFRLVTERVRLAANQVSRYSADLTQNAREATDATASANKAIKEISDRITGIIQSAAAIEESVKGAAVRAAAVEESARRMRKQMDVSNMVAERASKAVKGLISRLKDIGEVVRFSTDLAAQAGNLAREVARESGYLYDPHGTPKKDGGQTFAPEPLLALATEMDRRSQHTQAAAAEIAGLVEDIRVFAEDTASAFDEECGLITESHVLSREVAGALPGIVSSVELLSGHFREVRDLIGQVRENVQMVGRLSDEHSDLVGQIEEAATTLDTAAQELQDVLATLKA
ncbi:MAG: methyl-accepting chemotaxis protein [Candidatus Desulforudis sp.]|nr:methyl-accepting chemotaxis protein [Desulforudis sp.]